MSNLENEFQHPQLTTEEKAVAYDLQYGLWRAIGENGQRKVKGVSALILHVSPFYSGEFDKDYNLIGLGKAGLVVELDIFYENGRKEWAFGQIDRNDNKQLTSMAGELLQEILNK